jgi:hypothetical protein
METQRASIDYASLAKGDRIEGNNAWNFFRLLHPDRVENWIAQHGSEENAKLAKLSQVLLDVRDWIDKQRRATDLVKLIMTTGGGGINVLTDEEASRYCDNQGFAGLRKHAKYTALLISAVDDSQLSSAARREHENRVRTHSFVLASTQGAQSQLRKLRQAGKEPPRLS